MSDFSRKLLKFILVGGTATLTHILILFFLTETNVATPVYASAIGFAASSLLNYYMNYRYTFNSNVSHYTAITKFYIMAITGLFINTITFKFFMVILSVHPVIIQIPTTIIVLIWNFSVSYLWTFKSQ